MTTTAETPLELAAALEKDRWHISGVTAQRAADMLREYAALAPTQAAAQPEAAGVLKVCAAWCDDQAKSDWYGRTAGDMVRAFAALSTGAGEVEPDERKGGGKLPPPFGSAQPVPAADVQPCGHPASFLLRSAETGLPLYCEICDYREQRDDAVMVGQELREQVAQLVRALREATEGQTFMGEPALAARPTQAPAPSQQADEHDDLVRTLLTVSRALYALPYMHWLVPAWDGPRLAGQIGRAIEVLSGGRITAIDEFALAIEKALDDTPQPPKAEGL
jgi:hypothetical protein